MFNFIMVVLMDSAGTRGNKMNKFAYFGFIIILISLFQIKVSAEDIVLPDIPGGTELSATAANEQETSDADAALLEDLELDNLLASEENNNTVTEISETIVTEEEDSSSQSEEYGVEEEIITGSAQHPIVNKIVVRGGFITVSEIQAKMGTREGRVLDRKILEEDFQRLYKSGQFADVQIKEEVLPDYRVNIIVLLREKNIIRRISFRGNDTQKARKFEKIIKSKIDERYDEGQATRDAREIEEYYHDKFYYFAKVTPEAEPFEDGVKLVFNIDEGHKLWIRDIMFRGNYRFTDETLRDMLKTRQSSFFSRGKLNRKNLEEDLERLKLYYQSNGYLDVEVTERPFQVTEDGEYDDHWFARDEAHLYIDINEGEQYRVGSISFEGNKLVSDNDLRNVIQTMPGKIYSPLTAMEDSTHIRDIYGATPNSRYFTKIFPERVLTEQPNVVDVVFHINESPQVIIEDVQIVGNTKTKDRVFRRELEFYPGEMIDSNKIEKSKNNIKNLDFVNQDTFDIAVKEGSAPDRARVVVDLEEKRTGNVGFGVGFSSDDPFAGSVTLSQRNFDFQDYPKSFKEFITGKSFTGAGQYASISASMGTKSKNYGLDFFNPWIFNKPIGWGFGTYWKTYEWDDFSQETIGAYTTFTKRILSPDLTASVTYRLDRVDMYDIESGASTLIKKEKGQNWLSSLTFGLTYDTRDNIFRPTKGIIASERFSLYGGPLGGNYSFWRNSASIQGFFPFFTDRKDRNWVISARTKLETQNSYDDDDSDTAGIPAYEMLYAGGIGSVRGWRSGTLGPHDNYTAIGGKTSQTNSVEMFAPIYEKLIEGSIFFDVGGAFPDSWSVTGGTEGGKNGGSGYRASVGFGLHVITPLSPMPVRIYFPIVLNKKDDDDTEFIQFSFGAQF